MSARLDAVDRAVGRWIANAGRVGRARWRVPLADHWIPAARIDVDGDWLTIERPLPAAGWALLVAGARLAGAAKPVQGVDAGPALRVEARLPEEGEPDRVIGAAVHELARGATELGAALERAGGDQDRESARRRGGGPAAESATVLPSREGRARGATAGDAIVSPVLTGARLAARCEAAGWPAATRASGVVTVDLAPGGARGVAEIHAWGPGLAGQFSLFARAALARSSRAAIAALLLQAAGRVRVARAEAEERVSGASARLRVNLAADAEPEALGDALLALAALARLAAREAALLRDPDLASAWLELRAPPAPVRVATQTFHPFHRFTSS